ncbi:MAG: energy-coupled thiamine transporter ThiT [Oscillospiraceae bacterium]|nr:energy-coupled thiamine transporter ThiT [Oscillospiraceae bacterium]
MKQQVQIKEKTQRMALTAIMLALATVLSMIPLYKMPLGGTLTPLSMLPIALVSIKYGVKWGTFTSLLYAVIQLGLGLIFDGILGWGLTPVVLVACIIFDYIIAFGILGLAGIFRSKGLVGICSGIAMTLFIRFASHVFSGTVLFASFMPEEWSNPFLYSICYNGAYMLPELILTMIGAVILFKTPQIKKIIKE